MNTEHVKKLILIKLPCGKGLINAETLTPRNNKEIQSDRIT